MRLSFLPVLLATGCFITAFAADPAPTPTPASSGVVQIDHEKVSFEKGAKLLENSEFKIMTSRRTGPGLVEIHAHDTDTFHIIDGTAEFVTGGTVVGLKTNPNGESMGKEITGGETHHLTKGDVIVIPRGTPHWFKEVNGPFTYYVVKVTK